ncbi:hypothetical protein, partial [Oceaniserpentilla sp. 4NH20-0058]|uniref:hypothetical protein n=1 Tax=Oceaniserpentilla sp. 4NH20-0058 TaxID=3127660 RepID=UPI0033429046
RCVGLFSYINGADIRQLVLTEVNIIGGFYVGGLAGCARSNNTLEANTMMGSVESIYSGGAYTGGLLGYINRNNVIRANLVSGRVAAEGDNVGGLIGEAGLYNTVEGNLSTAWVEGSSGVGGLLGGTYWFLSLLQTNTLRNNYWATDASGQSTSYGSRRENNYSGLELTTLRCEVTANGSDCSDTTLYNNWDTYGVTDTNGVFQPYWDFGSNQQLPALNLNGIIHRDSDGDGVADDIDVYPLSFAAST